jgi:hypothetical protein
MLIEQPWFLHSNTFFTEVDDYELFNEGPVPWSLSFVNHTKKHSVVCSFYVCGLVLIRILPIQHIFAVKMIVAISTEQNSS